MNKLLIIPDIHGRKFWKKDFAKYDKIIFLGDYLDPYLTEKEFSKFKGFSDSELFEILKNNLLNIIQLKKENFDKIILLLGNHDLPYMQIIDFCCRNTKNPKQIKEYYDIFMENKNLFQLCYSEKIGEKKYLFSHAGVLKPWLYKYSPLFGNIQENEIPNVLNTFLNKENHLFYRALSDCSYFRGGYDFCGSPVWADLREINSLDLPQEYYQIFGHTALKSPFITKDFACIDTQECFSLNESNELIKVN